MKLQMPHTLTLLFLLMAAALVTTWIIPQGQFQTEITESGREVVIADSFEIAEEREYLSPLALFTAIPRSFAAAQDIIFFLFIIGGVIAIIRHTGAIDAILGHVLEKLGGKPGSFIFLMILVFATTSSIMGASPEYIPFVPILVALCRSMRMDTMTAVGIIIVGYCIGYGTAAFNQFTVVIAQGIAEVPTYSGWQIRMSMLVPFVLIGAHHVWRYSRKVQLDPSASLLKDLDMPAGYDPPEKYPELTLSHIIILVSFLLALGIAVWGIATRGWYLNELGAAFMIQGVFTAIVGKIGPNVTSKKFIVGAQELIETALLVGIARGIALVMEDGQILHTIVHYLSLLLTQVGPEMGAIGMMIMQTLLNFFVPSGSGQAFVTMPLMAPLSDLIGVSRQVAVQAFIFGDGFANMLVPTNAVLMGILGMAGVPFDRWFRFCLPLFFKLILAASVVLFGMVVFGFS